jgi:hypothetical protein
VKNFASTSSIGHRVTAWAVRNSQAVALLQGRVGQVGLQLHHGHRRCRRQQVRIHQLRQVLGKPRELGVDLHLHARGHEAEAFQQALDIGVGALEAIEAEAAGDLRKFLGKLTARFAQVLQLLAVVA